jgi:hypothetical protein
LNGIEIRGASLIDIESFAAERLKAAARLMETGGFTAQNRRQPNVRCGKSRGFTGVSAHFLLQGIGMPVITFCRPTR